MKEYKYENLKKNITKSINETALEGWRVIAYSASNIFGSSTSYDVIYQRDVNYVENNDTTTEYTIVTTKGNIVDKINEHTKKGYKLVSFSNITIFGSSSTKYDLIFERTIKVL
jgi:hypothetical protein